MTIRFACMQCGQQLAADSTFSGQIASCPQCGTDCIIPAAPRPTPQPPVQPRDILFDCHHCGQNIAIDNRAAGMEVRCPSCSGALTVPLAGAQETRPTPLPDSAVANSETGYEARGSARSHSPAHRIGWMIALGLLVGLGIGMAISLRWTGNPLRESPPNRPVVSSPVVDDAPAARPEPAGPSPVPTAPELGGQPAGGQDMPDPAPGPATHEGEEFVSRPPLPDPVGEPPPVMPEPLVASPGELREWTSASGKTLTARLLDVRGPKALLQGANGKEYKIDLWELSQSDRELVLATYPAARGAMKPLRVFILVGQSNMQGHGRIQADPNRNGGRGSLEHLVTDAATAGTFRSLVDTEGNWRERDDVWISYADLRGPLTVGYGARREMIGPELGFGWVIGDELAEPVLLIKCAWGGKSLAVDFRPPGAGKPDYSLGEKTDAAIASDPSILGAYYRDTLAQVKTALANIENLVPGSDGRYVLAGFGWHQGWNDRINDKFNQEYESNMAHFIRDMRRDLGAPGLPFVIAETGMGGSGETHPRALSLMDAQAAVARQPEFRDNVAFVGTRDFWRPAEESPSKQGYHWNSNAETYYLIGEAMGKAMKQLLRQRPADTSAKRFHRGATSPAAERHTGRTPGIEQAAEKELLSSIAALKRHIEGRGVTLDDQQIAAHHLTIGKHREIFGLNEPVIRACCDLVATYDDVNGPLWIAQDGFNRKGGPPANDLHWTIYNVMQHIIDQVYTAANVARYGKMLNGYKFGCSAYFPGAVKPPAKPDTMHRVKINGSYRKTFKHAVMHEERPARRPTGAYLAPGSIVEVGVPASIVGKGYQVRVGAHSWDNSKKPRVRRLDRSSLLYPIDAAEVKVASPLGGGIYIEVPLHADAGIVEVTIRNAVRSPYFSAKPFHATSNAEWKKVERKHDAPWADFQSEKFMMQVPSSWVRKLDDPIALLQDWDAAMDAMNDLMGLPRVWDKETMYLQVDLQLRSSAYAPGYPTVNDRYDPRKEYDGDINHYLVRGPRYAPDYVFHEQGHGYLFVKFAGEIESAVNLLHVAVQHQKFGASLDEAFRGSRNFNKNEHRTLDNTAIAWMTSFSFVEKKPMDPAEKKYQLKGHAKFVDIARLFGWEVLGDFWRSWVDDQEEGRPWSKHNTDIDKLSLRLSQTSGVDLSPLLHFWGTPPRDAGSLRAAVAAERLPPSAAVYDTLVHYKDLVPEDNRAFRNFASKWWGKEPSSKGYWTEREHTRQWENFNEATAASIRAAVQEIIDLYFPGGPPRHPAPARKRTDATPSDASKPDG